MKEVFAQGRTIEEAVETGRVQLGCERDDILYEIIEMPKKGFLGFGNVLARVRVYRELDRLEKGIEYLSSILDGMGIVGYDLKSEKTDGTMNITIEGDKLGAVIGRRGETLDALQYLVSLIVNQGEANYIRVTLDSGSYREKREKTLQALAHKIAQGAVKIGRSTTLEPMNPYERRIIHAAVLEIPGATSSSVGDEPHRRVVISPIDKKAQGDRKPSGDRRPYPARGRRPQTARPAMAKAGERREAPKPVATGETTPAKEQQSGDKPLYSKIDLA